MANNVETQWQKAIEMKGKVQEFEQMLGHSMNTLEGMLDTYVRHGFPEDIASKYHRNYFIPEQETIEEVRYAMCNEHVDFLDRVIKELDKARNED